MKHQGALAVCFPGRAMLFLLFTLVVAATTHAAETPGVWPNSVLLGLWLGLGGGVRLLGPQTVLGATTYLHSINEERTRLGRKPQPRAFDDGYDPDKAPAWFKRMTKEGVF